MPNNPNTTPPAVRFLTLPEVSDILNVSHAQAYALVRSGALPAIKLGGRGQWRVEAQIYLGAESSPPMARQVGTFMTRPQRPTFVPVPTTSKVAL